VFFIHYFLLVSPQHLKWLNPPNAIAGALTWKDVIRSSQLLIVAAGFVFAAGAVIDAMTDGFIVRGASTSRSIHAWLSLKLFPSHEWLRILFNLILFFFWPPIIVVCTILSSSDHYVLYRVGLKDNSQKLLEKKDVTKAALRIFERMPPNMQESLDTPFCNQFDAAWQGLLTMLPEPHHRWVISLWSRNRDLASFLASGYCALAISSGFLLTAGRGLFNWTAVSSYILLCVLSWLLFGYISLVVRSIFAVLELVAVTTTSIIR
jgi:hypothetical protein